jgi:hypothetical protein
MLLLLIPPRAYTCFQRFLISSVSAMKVIRPYSGAGDSQTNCVVSYRFTPTPAQHGMLCALVAALYQTL